MELSYAIARYEQALELLPVRWQQLARRLPDWRKAQAEEFRLRTGRPMTVLTCEGEILVSDDLPRPLVTQSDLEQLCDMVTGYSRYAVSETLSKGYLIGRGGFRVGVCGTAVLRDGEVICEKEPCVYYMQAFADREEEIIIRLDDARECVPGVVTQYMPIPKED